MEASQNGEPDSSEFDFSLMFSMLADQIDENQSSELYSNSDVALD